MTVRLPLFPLGTVLFPGLVLPLHIFEDRYRALVRDLLDLPDGSPRHFGVVAIRLGREVGADGVRALYEVGCTAELRKVEAYEDGRFDIVSTGGTRFRLHAVDHDEDYASGQVEFLAELPGAGAAARTVPIRSLFADYQARLRDLQGEVAMELPDLPDDPVVLSYLIAAAMVLDLGDKQRLLGAADGAERLRLEAELLRRENGILAPLPSLPAVDLLRQGVTLN